MRIRAVRRISRRAFVQQLAFLGGGVVLLGGAGCKRDGAPGDAEKAGPAHRSLTDRQFKTMAAACERILPRDEDPGALDAQVPEYVDRALKTPELKGMSSIFIQGLDLLERRCKARFLKSF